MKLRTLFLGALAVGGLSFAAVADHISGPHSHCARATITPMSEGEVVVECEPVIVEVPNVAPVAVDDTASGLSLTDIAGNVLTNDTDAEGDPLTVVQPNADISVEGLFSKNYSTPGQRTINYEVTDGEATDAGVLTITVNNRSPVVANEGGQAQDGVQFTTNVLTNDSDPDGGTLSIVSPSDAAFASNGTFTKTYGSVGTKTANYTVSDGQGGTASGTLTVIVTSGAPSNTAPVAVDDSKTGVRNVAVTGNVLTNDTDANNNALSVVQPNSNIAANGSFSITNTTVGVFNYSYTVTDGEATDVGNLQITINNQAPVAVDDTGSGLKNTAIVGNVLANDSDPDGDTPLSVVQPNSNIEADGDFSITNTTAGTPTYNYTVQDSLGATDTGVLTLTVNEPTQPPPSPGSLVAFPGAEGFGRFSVGGRGGTVMQVTTLADSGAGSLRACVAASGPRTCVFRVTGYIDLNSSLDVVNPFITIAGETAPGKGITLRNASNLRQPIRLWTHDIIMRHFRIRPGGPHHSVGSNGDGFIVAGNNQFADTENVTDIIMDHMSFSWATDENGDNSPFADRITIQNSMFYEGLKGHSKGLNLRGCGVSVIRTLIASNTIRNPNHTCGKEIPGSTRVGGTRHGEVEFRNNAVYNGNTGFLDFWNGRGEGWGNYAGNVFKRGPDTPSGNTAPYPIDVYDFNSKPGSPADFACPGGSGCADWLPAGTSDPQHICVMQNAQIGNVHGPRAAPLHGVLDPRDAHVVHSTNCVTNPAVDPSEPRGLTGTVVNAPANPTSALQTVLNNAGAFVNNRDTADAGIVTNVLNGTGSIPTCVQSGANCSGLPWPTLSGGTNYPDTDTDGMDDTWETANLGGTSATASADADSDGYTNLEEFLHYIAATK